MKYIDNQGRLKFGKYKDRNVMVASGSWVSWAIATVPGFKEEWNTLNPPQSANCYHEQDWDYPVYENRNPMPDDNGREVEDSSGRVVGTRGYTKFNSDELAPTTCHSDGSKTVHCGGPCGDMYVDEFGNT